MAVDLVNMGVVRPNINRGYRSDSLPTVVEVGPDYVSLEAKCIINSSVKKASIVTCAEYVQ